MENNLTKQKIIIHNILAILRDLIIGFIIYCVIHYCYQQCEKTLIEFLKTQAIAIMCVMLPINIAGLGQAHLSMNEIEEKRNKKIEIFDKVRFDLKITLILSIFFFFNFSCKFYYYRNRKNT